MKKMLLHTILSTCLVTPILADKVTDEMDAASAHYKDGEFGAASSALQQALVYVNEKKAESLMPFFASELIGFKGQEIENQKGVAVFGAAGTMIERRYKLDGKYFTVNLALDSPMMTQYTSYVNNPQMASMMGLENRRVGKHKAMYNKKNGQIIMIYNNRFVVQINHAKHLSEEKLFEAAKGLKFDVLDKFK